MQLDRGNETTAANLLQAFINHVTGLMNGGVLPEEHAQALIDAATAAIEVIQG